MADTEFGVVGAPSGGQPGRMQLMVNLAGAAGSVMLVLGLGWWGYDLAMRDARGVPVVRALEGPARVAPADPGGEVVDHQGLAVNDVAASGAAAPPADRLILAPAPVNLTAEDAPGLSAAPVPPVAELVPASGERPDADTDADAVPAPVVAEDAVAAALIEALAEGEVAPEDGVDVAALDASGLPAPDGAITRSPRPQPRPARAPETTVAATPEKPNVIDPATLTPGTRLVQFGAFDSAEEAEAEWMRLAGRFGDLMAGKSMVVQAAASGGRTFFRLRAHGFDNEDDARRFCSALVEEGANCIPVAHR